MPTKALNAHKSSQFCHSLPFAMHRTRLVVRVHFVELVDAANAVVGEHQRARLDAKLARFVVLADLRTAGTPKGKGEAASVWTRTPRDFSHQADTDRHGAVHECHRHVVICAKKQGGHAPVG
jgi:hypothetical protein